MMILEMNKYQQATVQGMKTVLKASGLGMMAAVVVLILEWVVAVNWDARSDRRKIRNRREHSTNHLGLAGKNIQRRMQNMCRFVLKSVGIYPRTPPIDVNVQPADENEGLNTLHRT